MKRIISMLVLVCICISLYGCSYVENHYPFRKQGSENNTSHVTEIIKYNTNYPDAVLEDSSGSYVTVEQAERDLMDYCGNDVLYQGSILFDRLTYENTSFDSYCGIFWFDVSVEYEFGNENYRAQVKYNNIGGRFVLAKRDLKFWQISDSFTKFGVWQYDDGATKINVNFIGKNDSGTGYDAEWKITYRSDNSEHQLVDASSKGTKTVYGHNEWDGSSEYLIIELKEYKTNREGIVVEVIDCGSIYVYPWRGVFWHHLHAQGGTIELHQ